MNIKRPLMPGFLKKSDQKLLLNKPGIWSTRTHLVLYYGVMFILFLAVLCFLEPTDVRGDSTTKYWIGFVSVISGIGIIAWLIYLLRFNVFKKYGNINRLHGLGSFILYFIAAGVFVLFPFVHPVVESIRANMAYSSNEIVRDINDMNIKVYQLEYHDLLKDPWEHDTIALAKDLNLSEKSDIVLNHSVTTSGGRAVPFYKLDSARFFKRIANADSLVKLNDTLYLEYKVPDYTFIDSYMAGTYMKKKLLGALQIYKKAAVHRLTKADSIAIAKELGMLINKYSYQQNSQTYYWDGSAEYTNTRIEEVYKKYGLKEINHNINNIVSKKYRWENDHLPGFVRLFYYFTLGISLLLFIFRHSTIRTFFLTLLTGVLLTILTSMVFAFSHSNGIVFFPWLLIYLFLFFLGSLSTWTNNKRYAITGIMINLFVLIVPFLPVLIVGWCYELNRRRYDEPGTSYKIIDWDLYFLLAEIGGALLLLILLATYIGKLYRRWYSLPED
jgi:hypothetical protein